MTTNSTVPNRIPSQKKLRRSIYLLMRFVGLVLAFCAGLYAVATVWPSVGAQGADMLRGVIGDPAVAWLEGVVFQVQDSLLQIEYRLGVQPAVPWVEEAIQETSMAATVLPTPMAAPTSTTDFNTNKTGTEFPPTSTATLIHWPPPDIRALGRLTGEGKWSPYFSNARGQTVAYRTFLQPDSDRPFAVAAIVAVNLDDIRLEYVLGFEEPYFAEAVEADRTGIIPQSDKQPGILLAAFNSGFLTRHGMFGVMVAGRVLVPMVDGLGTLAIFPNGQVRIGVWGSDITSLEGISTLRQNGPIVIHDGKINPQALEDSLELWGASLSGEMATWRSAVGVSADGRTLYYAAGWSLDMPALARTLQTVGADAAIQLDINRYWVLFTTIRFDPDGPKATPLLDEMDENVDRYLYASSRDYFYLASKSL